MAASIDVAEPCGGSWGRIVSTMPERTIAHFRAVEPQEV